MHQNRTKRDNANPDLCKKLPPERSRYKYFSFFVPLLSPRAKDLLPLHMMLDFRLCIPDYVITVCMNAADPMHDKLSARPLVKYDITFPSSRSALGRKYCRVHESETAPCCSRKSPYALLCPALQVLSAFRHRHVYPSFSCMFLPFLNHVLCSAAAYVSLSNEPVPISCSSVFTASSEMSHAR